MLIFGRGGRPEAARRGAERPGACGDNVLKLYDIILKLYNSKIIQFCAGQLARS